MAKVHRPSLTRATLLYAAAGVVWLWAGTASGRQGSPPPAAVALMVLAMAAGPMALLNFWNIMWGSLRAQRSVPVFFLEMIYAAVIPGLLFGWQLRRFFH